MIDKRYPTRMHEVLGVATEERFTYSEYGDREFWLSESGLLYGAYDGGMSAVTQGTLVLFINHPERITRMMSIISIEENNGKHQIEIDLWDGGNVYAAFEINYCPMCGRKLEDEK